MAAEHGDSPFPHLFSPLALGRRTVRNRIALTATLTNFAAANRITERWTNFLVERARGGAGLAQLGVGVGDRRAAAGALHRRTERVVDGSAHELDALRRGAQRIVVVGGVVIYAVVR